MRQVYMNTTNQSVGNVWSPDNPNAHYPTYTSVSQVNNYNYRCSSWSVEDGSYLRLKNIEIGYTFPSKWLKSAAINGLRVYVNAQNLFTISDVPQIDPENTQQQGWTYPQMKAFNVGLTLQF